MTKAPADDFTHAEREQFAELFTRFAQAWSRS